MDEYGIFQACQEDWDEIATMVKRWRDPITFSYGHETCFIVTIGHTLIMGNIPWGGAIDGKKFVSLRLIGSNFFDFHDKRIISPEYISEKLGVSPGQDAEKIAELLNEIKKRMETDL